MKTYPLSVIAKKMHAWHYTAEKFLTANGVKPIHTKVHEGFGTYKTYAACEADPVIRKWKLEKAQKEAAKLQKAAKKAAKKVAKAAPPKKANDVVVVAKQESSNDEQFINGLRHLYAAVTALTKAVQENTQTIKDNGWVALDKATRPEKRMN